MNAPAASPLSALPRLRPLSRRDRTVAAILRSWRRLTTDDAAPRAGPGAPTLVACSGGADSSALLLALASATRDLTVAHIVHDLRPRDEALADRDAARNLAASLGLPFEEEAVSVTTFPGNPEGVARRLRYDALRRIALRRGLPFVATGHHAGDQLESVLMGLVRGAGPAGLSGVAAKRPLTPSSPPIWLIRPILAVSRADAERLCHQARWTWREDRTNRDTTRLRARIRHTLAPQLTALRPDAEPRIARTAALLRDAAGLVRDHAALLLKTAEPIRNDVGETTGFGWPRAALKLHRPIVLGEALRAAAASLLGGRRRDRLTARPLAACVRAVRDGSTEPRVFQWSGVTVRVTAATVEVALI